VKYVRSFGLMIAAIVAFVLVAGCGSATTTSQQAQGTPGVTHTTTGAEQLQFTAKTVDGQDFSGQSLVGKPAVLWFWAPWCPKCQREAPDVARVAHANTAVTFVGVAARDQLPAMKDFVSKYQLGSFQHLADVDGAVWQRFGVTQQPAFAFIGADGTVQVVKGALSEQALTERVSRLASA
jgi:thiol-disulfide isomerase/thioredoxin